jgi:hypothetical protein
MRIYGRDMAKFKWPMGLLMIGGGLYWGKINYSNLEFSNRIQSSHNIVWGTSYTSRRSLLTKTAVLQYNINGQNYRCYDDFFPFSLGSNHEEIWVDSSDQGQALARRSVLLGRFWFLPLLQSSLILAVGIWSVLEKQK